MSCLLSRVRTRSFAKLEIVYAILNILQGCYITIHHIQLLNILQNATGCKQETCSETEVSEQV